jgi:hypothetical protein
VPPPLLLATPLLPQAQSMLKTKSKTLGKIIAFIFFIACAPFFLSRPHLSGVRVEMPPLFGHFFDRSMLKFPFPTGLS